MGGEDGFGCPCEGLWVLVAMLDPCVDRGFKFHDIMENAAPDAGRAISAKRCSTRLSPAPEVGVTWTFKLFTRCGLSRCPARIRCTLVRLTPISSASSARSKGGALAGRSFPVFATILRLIAAADRLVAGLAAALDAGLDENLRPAPRYRLRVRRNTPCSPKKFQIQGSP